jgi:drug/metabolite transporter (DMT)-like permease
MGTAMTSISSIGAIIAAGTCFMLANLALKALADKPFYVLYGVAGAAILGGCVSQALAFRGAQFGLAVVLILGLEMLFSIVVARAFFGETYSATNMAGVLLVITGMGLVHVPAAAQPETADELDGFPTTEIEKGPRPIVSAQSNAIADRLNATTEQAASPSDD